MAKFIWISNARWQGTIYRIILSSARAPDSKICGGCPIGNLLPPKRADRKVHSVKKMDALPTEGKIGMGDQIWKKDLALSRPRSSIIFAKIIKISVFCSMPVPSVWGFPK